MLRSVLPIALALACFAAPVAAEPVVLSFSGYLSGTSDEAPDRAVSEAFAPGTTVSGRFVYEGGAPLTPYPMTPFPGTTFDLKHAFGPQYLKSGEATIDDGEAATTVRHLGVNPALPPSAAEFYAHWDTRIEVYESADPPFAHSVESIAFGLGGDLFMDENGLHGVMAFSESNDRTGGYEPMQLTLVIVNSGYTDGRFPTYDRTGLIDFDAVPTDLSDFVATSEVSLVVGFVSPEYMALLWFNITEVAFEPLTDDVPEPGALGLLGLGLLGLCLRRRPVEKPS